MTTETERDSSLMCVDCGAVNYEVWRTRPEGREAWSNELRANDGSAIPSDRKNIRCPGCGGELRRT